MEFVFQTLSGVIKAGRPEGWQSWAARNQRQAAEGLQPPRAATLIGQRRDALQGLTGPTALSQSLVQKLSTPRELHQSQGSGRMPCRV